MRVAQEVLASKKASLSAMKSDRLPWWNAWRDLANYILPARYTSLQSKNERAQNIRNTFILDSTGTRAARILAAGMMNGIISPARPWFKLRVAGFEDNLDYPARVWLDEVERRMYTVMAESNFYNSMATTFLDLSVFGTACSLIYEDAEKVIHCHNAALGEFYLMIDPNHSVCGLAREIDMTVYQMVMEFGEENCSQTIREAWKKGGADHHTSYRVIHLIEPNSAIAGSLSPSFKYREYYWMEGTDDPLQGGGLNILRIRGYFDFPGICPRWELGGNDAYGTSPGMDALGDIIQLQHETKKKAQGIDKMISPPMLADITMEHKPTALLPNSITYVSRLESGKGMRPAYEVNPPIQALTEDLIDIRQRIGATFYNFLFNDISQIDTVRSATEIAARKEEKLILLGPVLERFENEAIDPSIKRVFGIMARNRMLPDPPNSIRGRPLTIHYVSILAAAQSAVGTIPTERLLQVIGNLVQVFPEARLVPKVTDLLLDYARDTGVPAKNLHTRQEIADQIAQENANSRAEQQAAMTQQAAETGQTLSQTDVGGGANALQQVLGRS